MSPVRVISSLPQALAAIEAIVAVFVAKVAHDIEAWAKVHAPVDTGFLRGSIRAVPGPGGSWIVQAGADYAAYVELGTVNNGAQPYLLPAVEVTRANIGGAAMITGPPAP